MPDADLITKEIQALERLDLEGLRAEWRRRYGPPPKLRSPQLLTLMLAWRIQSQAYGGLDASARRRLRGATTTSAPANPGVGARITREWGGRLHVVETTAEGFRYDGVDYRSLSKVAHAITGAKWNGPKFFGLRGGVMSA